MRALRVAASLTAFALAAGASASRADASASRAPNVLVITADDLGAQLGCYGDTIAATPNLDRLAHEGMRFDRAYATQSSCSPSRASLLTGLYPHQHEQTGLAPFFRIRDGVSTLPEILHEHGYRTGVVGKLHVGGIPKTAFDVRMPKEEEPRAAKSHRDVRIPAQLVREFLDGTAGQPFFLLLNLIEPHRPFSAQVAGLPESPLGAGDVGVFPFLGIERESVRQAVADYYNGIARMDTGVGLVLDALDEKGLVDDTLIVFLGDHGPGFTRSKTTCYEAGTHIPCLVRWPARIPAGSSTEAFISVVDLAPTILEAAGAPVPEGLAGASLFPLAQGNAEDWRTALFTEFEFHGPGIFVPRRAIREGSVHLIVNLLPGVPNPAKGIDGCSAWEESRTLGDSDPVRRAYATYDVPPPIEIYDLAKDPGELLNLADVPEMVATRERLLGELQSWRVASADPLLNPEELARLSKVAARAAPDSVQSPR